MILDRQLDPDVLARRSVLSRWRSYTWPPAARNKLFVFVLFFGLVALLQMASGAYHAEFAGYPDEPAHYVTSLMVHDYVTGLKPVAPMQFAWNFYYHYPKVAFGHWPPFFYVVQAGWMILFSTSRASVHLELAFITALLAYAVYAEARRWFGWRTGILAGLLTICLPLVQICTDEEMSETLLVLLCLWSAIYFARYIDSGEWRDNLWFGVFFSLAVLTKGNGWLLALIPPIALLLTRKVRLLLRPSFWLAPLLITVTCVPWQLMTLDLAERGWAAGTQPTVHYAVSSLGQFLAILIAIGGPFLSILSAIGIVVTVLVPMFRKRIASGPAVMLALILAVWIFHSLVPAGVEDRKMVIAVPALVLFLFAGGFWIADQLPLGNLFATWKRPLVAFAAALVFALQSFAIPHLKHYGFTEAAQYIMSHKAWQHDTILVSSESGGEGLLVSEIAMRPPRPGPVIVRGTKALAQVDWAGFHYRSLFSSPAEVVDYLERRHIDFVVLDTFAPEARFLHSELLRQAVQRSGHLHLIATFPPGSSAQTGQIQLYRVGQ